MIPSPEQRAEAGRVRRGAAAVASLVLVVVAFSPAEARKCASAKLKAAGKRAAAEIVCHAKAVTKGGAVDPACLAKASAGFTGAFAKAEGKGDCVVIGDANAVGTKVATTVAQVAARLGGPGPSACTQRKLRAAAKEVAARHLCQAAAVAKGRGYGVDPKCQQRAATAFLKAFAKAEAKGDCIAAAGDAVAVQQEIVALMLGSRASLSPPISTCTPLTATAVHGDRILPGARLARIENGKVPCLHVEDATVTKCTFSTAAGSASGDWLESPDGIFAKVGVSISKDGLPNGEYVVASDVRDGPSPCLESTGMDTMGRVSPGEELAATCVVEDLGQDYNAMSAVVSGFFGLVNWTDAVVCSSTFHLFTYALYVGDGGHGPGVHCYTGTGAALNDINGMERDQYTNYYTGEGYCHYIENAGFEVPGAKRPATRSLPAPGVVKVNTPIVWRPVVPHIDIANVAPPAPSPSPTPSPTATPTPSPTPTPTSVPDYVVDTVNDDPARTACDPELPDDCSLRGALIAAATRLLPSTIAVPAGQYLLSETADCSLTTTQFGTLFLSNTNTLCVPGNVTLRGAGPADTIIDADARDRAILVGDGGPVRIEGVTVRGGRQQGGSLFGGGGAINNGGDLTLADCAITANVSDGSGGGVYSSGTLDVQRCTVSGNTSAIGGGGIYADSFNIPVNTSIVDSAIVGNVSSGAGHGGGLFVAHGNQGGSTTVRGSTIADNEAVLGGGAGVFANGIGGTLVLVNSTISGNRAGWCCGGGIWHVGAASTHLRNVTVSGNRSRDVTGTRGIGGGIATDASGVFTLANSIVAFNDAPELAPDCYDGGGSFTSAGYNLIKDQGGPAPGGTYCDLVGGAAGDTFDQDPLLQPLADNGGPTETHLPGPGSPVIDTGDPGGCADPAGDPLTTDQRGAPRPIDGDGDDASRCDRGAVEAGGS